MSIVDGIKWWEDFSGSNVNAFGRRHRSRVQINVAQHLEDEAVATHPCAVAPVGSLPCVVLAIMHEHWWVAPMQALVVGQQHQCWYLYTKNSTSARIPLVFIWEYSKHRIYPQGSNG